METPCEYCNKTFQQKSKYPSKWTKTCSVECRRLLAAKSTRESSGRYETATCIGCGNEYQNAVKKPKKYCTWDCMMDYRAREARDSRTCQVCGTTFTFFKRQDQRTCSAACRNKLTGSLRENHYPECTECGSSTGSYNRIYCDEHRPGRPGRKPTPRKTATCLGCGEEFSRPGTWPGKMNYCSNKCSHSQQKKVRDKFVLNLNEHAVVFHSGWEIRFWAACLRFDIPIRSYDGPDIQTPAGTYRPDFIINDDTVVEVKGWLRPESAVKIDSAALFIDKEALLAFERDGALPTRIGPPGPLNR